MNIYGLAKLNTVLQGLNANVIHAGGLTEANIIEFDVDFSRVHGSEVPRALRVTVALGRLADRGMLWGSKLPNDREGQWDLQLEVKQALGASGVLSFRDHGDPTPAPESSSTPS